MRRGIAVQGVGWLILLILTGCQTLTRGPYQTLEVRVDSPEGACVSLIPFSDQEPFLSDKFCVSCSQEEISKTAFKLKRRTPYLLLISKPGYEPESAYLVSQWKGNTVFILQYILNFDIIDEYTGATGQFNLPRSLHYNLGPAIPRLRSAKSLRLSEIQLSAQSAWLSRSQLSLETEHFPLLPEEGPLHSVSTRLSRGIRNQGRVINSATSDFCKCQRNSY